MQIIQCNLDKSYSSHNEFIDYFISKEYTIGLISEPYVGNSNTVKNIAGYEIHQFTNSDRVKACIIIKSGIVATLGMSEYSSPNMCVVQLVTNGRKLFLISIYIEPRTDEGNTLNRLEMFLKNNNKAHIIIGGDFNGWHPAWGSPKTNKRGTDVNTLIVSHDLVIGNTGNTPTFMTVSHGIQRNSIIDLTLYSDNISHRISNWKVNTEACPSSEHEAIDFSINLGDMKLKRRKKQSTYKYVINDNSWIDFKHNLKREMEDSKLKEINLESLNEQKLEQYTIEITKTIQKTCDKSFSRKKQFYTHVPWWNSELDDLKKEVIKIHHRLQDLVRSGKPIHNVIAEKNELKDKYVKCIRKTSTEHFRQFCCMQGKENVWSLTNRLLKNAPQPKPCMTVCDGDDSTHTTTPSDTAMSLLNKFYPDDTTDTTDTQRKLRIQMAYVPNTPDDTAFTEDEVLGCLQSMSAKKAPGVDHLTADICLTFATENIAITTKILNRCLQLSYFPTDWKIAQVLILPKPNKNDYSDTAAYRPIGLINIFGKLLEKLICKRLTYHLDKANLSNPLQFGFKELTSTTDALNTAISKIKEAKKNKKLVIAISLDIKAAFDNAWWPVLFKRLKRIKCPKNLYKIILNYVQNRRVILNYADITVSKIMSRGCIQGSVCGPLFWNLILDDLFDVPLPEGCHIQAFADDVLLIIDSKKPADLQIAANKALDAIIAWGCEVKLNFGPSKTQAIAFTPKARTVKIRFDNTEIEFIDEIKILGVIIDKNLKFIKHAKYIINKSQIIYKKLSKYVRPTWGAQPENIRTIYKQVIVPIITYAAGIWGTAIKYETVKNQLRSLQRGFAIKIIRAFRTVSATAAIALAKLTPLHLKVEEVAALEIAKATGITPLLPDDITLEKPAHNRELLHPACRKFIEFDLATDQEDINKLCPPDYTVIYTDGSKHSEDKVGAAFVAHKPDGTKVTKKIKLHGSCSVYQAELLAIQNACSWATQNKITKLAILTDSLSSLFEIKNKDSNNKSVATIHDTIHFIDNSDGKVVFIWVKAHAGLEGNEEADEAAKAAAMSHRSFEYSQFPISHLKLKIKTINKDKSVQIFNSGSQGEHTRKICHNLETIHELFATIKPSFELTQILTGHGYHLTYLNRFKIKNSELCPCDLTSPQTIQHLLEACPKYHFTRHEHTSTCSIENIDDPYNMTQLVKKPKCITTFEKHAKKIVQTLKEFNKDIM